MSIGDKKELMQERFNSYIYWVESFMKEPTRQKKMRIKEKSRMFSAVKNQLNAEIQSTMCGWGDPRTSKKDI